MTHSPNRDAPSRISHRNNWLSSPVCGADGLLGLLESSGPGFTGLLELSGSLLGSLIGQLLPFDLTGIDFAMTALFTVIFTEQTADAIKAFRAGELSLTDALFPTLLGLLATLLSLLIVGTDSFLLCAMAVMLACFFLRYQAGGKEARA